MLLERGSRAFAAGDFAGAAADFTRVERDFGGERDWRSGALPRRLLPLRGFAQWRAGLPSEAVESFEAYLERFPNDAAQRGFVLYAMAMALRDAGRPREALARFEQFEALDPGSDRAAVARLQRAEISAAAGRIDEALGLLEALAENSAAAESLRLQARLQALRLAVDGSRDEAAARLLLGGRPWDVAAMPELAVLAFAAMETGDRLLALQRPAEALRAYRVVLPKPALVRAQAERVAELDRLLAERSAAVAASGGAFWVEFHRARLERARGQLRALEQAGDYTAGLRLRMGQACLLDERPHEAWLLFESVAMDPAAADALRQAAHHRWALAAAKLEAWDEALAVAREFVERFPAADEAPEVFYLIARTHVEQRRWAEAEEVLGGVLARFPGHAGAERARFTRGWVRAMREAFAEAREDFEACAAAYPNGPFKERAALWHALTLFFERRHAEALAEFESLAAQTNRGHPLFPEIAYRRGVARYALRDLAGARREMEEFARSFPRHARRNEALVLLGGILMGEGDLAAAKRAFAQIDPEAAGPFAHGVFQTGKILRAEEDYAGMAAHFRAYLARDDAAARPRSSEALHWIGWAEEQQGRPEAALEAYFAVLDRFGGDPAAGEVGAALRGLERLARRIRGRVAAGEGVSAVAGRAAGLVSGEFDDWLAAEKKRAAGQGRPAMAARMGLLLAERHGARKEAHQEEAMLLALAAEVPMEAFDDAGLARVGAVLQAIGSPTGEACFRRLVERFPHSPERAAAFHGLAVRAAGEGATAEALGWLDRFDRETPMHRLAPKAALLAGEVLEGAGRAEEAAARYEALLRLKAGRGRAHAQALLGLGRCMRASGEPKRAIAYFQRVFTLYRAHGDLAGEGYAASADLFAEIGDARAAAATWREMLATPAVGDAAAREHARQALEALGPLAEEPETEAAREAPGAP